MTALLHRLCRYGAAVIMTLLIPVLSLLPARFFAHIAGPPPFPGMDKLIHALMYAALTAALLHALSPPARVRYLWAFRLALAASLYGLVMELCQKILTDTRSLDPLDAFANMTGAFVIALLACAWARRRRKPH